MAALGLYVAYRTMNEAHEVAVRQEERAREEAIKALEAAEQSRNEQQAEFKAQMEQLGSTSSSLTLAANLLKRQTAIQNLQLANSTKQTGILDEENSRAKERPRPVISARCNGPELVNSDEQADRRSLYKDFYWSEGPSTTDIELNCSPTVRNLGKSTLKKASLQFSVYGCGIGTSSSTVRLTDQFGNNLANSFFGIHETDIDPETSSTRRYFFRVTIKKIGECKELRLSLHLESQNYDSVEASTVVKFKN